MTDIEKILLSHLTSEILNLARDSNLTQFLIRLRIGLKID